MLREVYSEHEGWRSHVHVAAMTEQEHLLTILAEECNEVAQRASKALRFGLFEVQSGQYFSNAERVFRELRDVEAVEEMLQEIGALPKLSIHSREEMIEAKKRKVKDYMGLARKCGTLEP